eukprot:1008267-Amorphochlora_amoeboformis.AAC.1
MIRIISSRIARQPFFILNLMRKPILSVNRQFSSQHRRSERKHRPSGKKEDNFPLKVLDKLGIKHLWDEYGMVGVWTLLSIDALTIGGTYITISNVDVDLCGLVVKYDFLGMMDKFGIAPHELTSQTTNWVTTFTLYKVMPVFPPDEWNLPEKLFRGM